MNIVLFNGALERRTNATSHKIASYFKDVFEKNGNEVTVFNVSESGIPLFDVTLNSVPKAAEVMANIFRQADIHIWLTPLYHGGMTGVMKNCLDWLEISSKEYNPYLTDKTIGLICWADGSHAMQGINNMDAVAKSLRAWTLPFSIPIVRNTLFDIEENFTEEYTKKFDQMARLLLKSKSVVE